MASALGKFIGASIANTVKNAYNTAKKNSSSSSGSSGSSSSSSSSRPSSGTASSATGSSASSNDWLKQAQANSQAWHTADAATKKDLQEANRKLYTAHGYTYDGKTGTWSAPKTSGSSASNAANLIGGIANTAMGAYNQLKNQNHSSIPSSSYMNTDLGNTFWQAATAGSTDVDYLQSIADERLKKAQANSNLNQYANDQNQLAMQAYINRLKQTQEYANQYNQYYEDAMNKQQEAYTQAAEQAAQQYRQLMPTMNQSYDEAARQAYINYRTAQRDLPEQLAAAGISGQGAAESSLVQQNNAYNQAYNQNEQARAQALANLENQAANAYNTTANQGLQSVADLMAQQAQAQQNILAQQEQMRQNAIGNLYNYNNAMGAMGGMPTLDAQQTLANIAYNKRQLDLQQQSQNMSQSQFEQNLKNDQNNEAWNRAYQMWQLLGTRGATPEIAAILNIPVGAVAKAGSYNPNYY